jgi:hypothetical protein
MVDSPIDEEDGWMGYGTHGTKWAGILIWPSYIAYRFDVFVIP